MELFAIAFSIPAGWVVSMGYCWVLVKAMRRLERLRMAGDRFPLEPRWATVVRRMDYMRAWFRWISTVVLSAFVIELIFLSTLGSVRSRAILGPLFHVGHVLIFLLGMPALANVLILGRCHPFVTRWYLATPLCTILAFLLVVLQYAVSEALYGHDGMVGPYG